MDGIIILVIIIVVGVYFRRVDKVVTGVAIVDIFLRLFRFLVENIQINGISGRRIIMNILPVIFSVKGSQVSRETGAWELPGDRISIIHLR